MKVTEIAYHIQGPRNVPLFNSFTMGTSGWPDIYTQAQGLRVYNIR